MELSKDAVVGGDFRVIEPLGAGGMGAVYVAEQLSTGRRRALKVMHRQSMGEPRHHERFIREAKVGALIKSQHVVEVIAAGVDRTGMPWLVMELLEGCGLWEYVHDHGNLPKEQLLAVFEQLCHALGAAHEAGVVHMDVKPENVFVSRISGATPGSWSIKVLDFGIARMAAEARSGATTAIGSPIWMAPEQADPDAIISLPADVWPLGLMAFWMLTGQHFWLSARSEAPSIHAIMKEILFDAVPLASSRASQLDVADRLPAGFDDWFDRCVHREQRARFQDAHALLDGLRTMLGKEVQPARVLFDWNENDPAIAGIDADSGVGEPMSTRAFLSQAGLGPSAEGGVGNGVTGGSDAHEDQPAETDARLDRDMVPGLRSEELQVRDEDGVSDQDDVPASDVPRVSERINNRRRSVWVVGGGAVGLVALIAFINGDSDPESAAKVVPSPTALQPVLTAPLPTPTSLEAPPPALSEVPSATALVPSASVSAASTAEASASTPPVAAVFTSSQPRKQADPKFPPFDVVAAQTAVDRKAQWTSRACPSLIKPMTVTGAVSFLPTGAVDRVYMVRATAVGAPLACVRKQMSRTLIAAFDGPAPSVSFAVVLQPTRPPKSGGTVFE